MKLDQERVWLFPGSFDLESNKIVGEGRVECPANIRCNMLVAINGLLLDIWTDFLDLARHGFYDGTTFFRLVKDLNVFGWRSGWNRNRRAADLANSHSWAIHSGPSEETGAESRAYRARLTVHRRRSRLLTQDTISDPAPKVPRLLMSSLVLGRVIYPAGIRTI